jgi:hypothetical protein
MSKKLGTSLQILAKRIIVKSEIVGHEWNPFLRIFVLFCKIYLPPEAGMVVRNMSA